MSDKNDRRPPFPAGCTIRNIRRGAGSRSQNVYACLYGPDDELLIAATLEYINQQFLEAGVTDAKKEVAQ